MSLGKKNFGLGLKWALKIKARPGHGPKPMLAFGPGWAGPSFGNILKNYFIFIILLQNRKK